MDVLIKTSITGEVVLTNVATGKFIDGVVKADIEIVPHAKPIATLRLSTNLDLFARGEFVCVNPATGEYLPVKRIEYADGTVWAPHG